MIKKGQSISINTIIVAAIALAVLVVIFLIFTGRLGLFTKGVGEATNCEQACKSAGFKGIGQLNNPGSDGSYQSCEPTYAELTGYYEIEGGVKKKCCCNKEK